jgi:RNA polymerase subunit RPABC4/transcription elongation factor Spt4
MALINCPECHKQVSDKAKVCPHCKKNIEDKAQLCPECNETISKNAKACPLCGFPLRESTGRTKEIKKDKILSRKSERCPRCKSYDITYVTNKKGGTNIKKARCQECFHEFIPDNEINLKGVKASLELGPIEESKPSKKLVLEEKKQGRPKVEIEMKEESMVTSLVVSLFEILLGIVALAFGGLYYFVNADGNVALYCLIVFVLLLPISRRLFVAIVPNPLRLATPVRYIVILGLIIATTVKISSDFEKSPKKKENFRKMTEDVQKLIF